MKSSTAARLLALLQYAGRANIDPESVTKLSDEVPLEAESDLRDLQSGRTSTVPAATDPRTLQARNFAFAVDCFGEGATDPAERNHRFLEEALEMVQASGCTAAEARMLVDYVFGRPAGEPAKEAGQVLMTLGALCSRQGIDMLAAGEAELARALGMIDKIRAKRALKPQSGPLPTAAAVDAVVEKRNDDLEAAYWEFDARRKGDGQWKLSPQSERDAFKQVVAMLMVEGKL